MRTVVILLDDNDYKSFRDLFIYKISSIHLIILPGREPFDNLSDQIYDKCIDCDKISFHKFSEK
jgi:hypothetical protein